MAMHRSVLLALVLACAFGGCGDDNGGGRTDGATDGDAGADADADADADAAGVTYSTCLKSCTTPDDCCLSAGPACGDYPNRWTCDTVCLSAGCTDNAQCVAWAAGLPGADNYRCSTTLLYWTADYCTGGCTTPEDCCPAGVDCSAYPRRRVCDGGACKLDGCADDAECRTWATGLGAPNPDNWVCRSAPYTDAPFCTVACTTTDDCCPGGCLAYPNRLACIGGFCASTCADDAECRTWATDSGQADPEAYVCHPFSF